MKAKHLAAALVCGSITGGVFLDVLGLPAAVASGAAAGVTAAIAVYARRVWN
jgi:predicted MFS family arabinose efflux permease